jgi:uncharacterized protein YbjT (DUF2867 family)
MRVAVFGATGRTGRHLVEQALARGHDVAALVRRPSDLDERLRVVQGDARDPAALREALADRETAISVLALARPEDEPAYSNATRAIVEAVQGAGVRRLVVTANNDVFGDDEVSGTFAAHAREHRRNRETLHASGLDWTIVAAPWVVDEPAEGSYVTAVGERAPGRKITTGDLATVVLDAVERPDWIGRIVGVSN